jgi:hypothetical protein
MVGSSQVQFQCYGWSEGVGKEFEYFSVICGSSYAKQIMRIQIVQQWSMCFPLVKIFDNWSGIVETSSRVTSWRSKWDIMISVINWHQWWCILGKWVRALSIVLLSIILKSEALAVGRYWRRCNIGIGVVFEQGVLEQSHANIDGSSYVRMLGPWFCYSRPISLWWWFQ